MASGLRAGALRRRDPAPRPERLRGCQRRRREPWLLTPHRRRRRPSYNSARCMIVPAAETNRCFEMPAPRIIKAILLESAVVGIDGSTE
jgi:hypothetical protein